MDNFFDRFDGSKDLALSFGTGANSLLKMGGDLWGFTGLGSMDNWASKQGQENIEYLQQQKSPELRKAQEARKKALEESDNPLKQAYRYFTDTVSDPQLVANDVVESLPNLALAGGAGKAAQLGAGLIKPLAKKATEIGVAAAVAAGAGAQGLGVARDQYDTLVQTLDAMDEETARKIPQIRQLMDEEGASLEHAKAATAMYIAKVTGILATVLSAGAQMIPGGRTIENALVGKVAAKPVSRLIGAGVGALGEAASESVENVSGEMTKNLLARPVDPERKILAGTGEQLGASWAPSLILGAGTGAANAHPSISQPVPEGRTTAGMSGERPASAATKDSVTDQPSMHLEGADKMSQEEFDAAMNLRDAQARGVQPPAESMETARRMKRPKVEFTEEEAAPARAAVEGAVAEWREANPDATHDIEVVYDPNMVTPENHGIEGYFDPKTRKVVINAAFIEPGDVTRVANHEWAHHTVSTPEGMKALTEFATREIPQGELDELAKRYPRQEGQSEAEHRLLLVDEWIAQNAEQAPGVLARIIAKLREWFSGTFGIEMTHEEVARALLRSLREQQKGVSETPVAGEMATEPRMSLTMKKVKEDPSMPRVESLRSFFIAPDGSLYDTGGPHDRFAVGALGKKDAQDAIKSGYVRVNVSPLDNQIIVEGKVTQTAKKTLDELRFGQNMEVIDGLDGRVLMERPDSEDFGPRYSTTKDKVTDTPEFKKWFGGSKVVDEQGKPLVVYHGTNKEFTQFNTNDGKSLGSYFSESPEYANVFSKAGSPLEDLSTGGKVYPVYLSLKNPASMADIAEAIQAGAYERKAMREWLVSKGFDGVMKGDEIIAFYPEQIKSAIGNKGTFDPTNPDIRYSVSKDKLLATEEDKPVSGIMASPSITDINYDRAKRNLTSANQARFKSQISEYAPGAKIFDAVGDWADGAENSVAAIFDSAKSPEELQRIGAKAGLAGDQKAILWWTTDREGKDAIHQITWPKEVSMDDARQAMIDAGLENRTLIETPEGIQGFVFDQGQQNLNKIKVLHENSTDPTIASHPATGDFLGSWTSRTEGRMAYRNVLGRATEAEAGTGGREAGERTDREPEVRYSLTPEEEADLPLRLGTSNPTAVNADERGHTHDTVIDLERLRRDPDLVAKVEETIRQTFPYLKLGDDPIGALVGHVKDNLLFLHDRVPDEVRAKTKRWYDGARKIALEWSKRYNLPKETVAGVMAALSPQKDWFQNLALAERVIDTFVKPPNGGMMSKEMDDVITGWVMKAKDSPKPYNKNALSDATRRAIDNSLIKMRHTPFSELGVFEQAVWMRAYSEAHLPKSYATYSPEGEPMDIATTKFKKDRQLAWSGFNNELSAAISILRNGSRENISDQLGTEHKVRNFFNNILLPNDPRFGDVTIDTHAVAAGLLKPLAGTDVEVEQNFGSSGGSSVFGVSGMYPVYAEAYRQAAKERGLLPREMQSITWEAVRGLFPAELKKGLKNQAVKIWNDYGEGKISIEEARGAIEKVAGGIRTPEWLRSDSAVSSGKPAPRDIGKLLRTEPTRLPRELHGGSGGYPSAESSRRMVPSEPSEGTSLYLGKLLSR